MSGRAAMSVAVGAGSARARVLVVTAGTGPVEVRRFVGLLAGHLCERCSEMGAVVREVVAHGDESAPASVEIHLLSASAEVGSLEGTHALVARSEDRGKKARKRWFAGARLFDEEEGAESGVRGGGTAGGRGGAVTVRREDVTITAARAGGPGGQHVNKTMSAVRVEHAASGITVRVAEERSQHDNVKTALERIGKILSERARERSAGAKAGRRLSHYRVERGRPAFLYEIDRDGGLAMISHVPRQPNQGEVTRGERAR
jgi:protein subunit release factor B